MSFILKPNKNRLWRWMRCHPWEAFVPPPPPRPPPIALIPLVILWFPQWSLKCEELIHLIHHVSPVPATMSEVERCNKHWLNELPNKIIPKGKPRFIIINSFDQTKEAGSHIPSSLSILIYSLFKKESSLHYIKLNHNFLGNIASKLQHTKLRTNDKNQEGLSYKYYTSLQI